MVFSAANVMEFVSIPDISSDAVLHEYRRRIYHLLEEISLGFIHIPERKR